VIYFENLIDANQKVLIFDKINDNYGISKKTASHYVTLEVETYSILLQQVPTLLGSCKQPSVTLNKM